MAGDNVGSGARPSWHEREIALALQRLANARAHLAQLEEQDRAAPAPVERDPADLARVAELQRDITRFTAKASGRFGGSSARAKLDEAERELRLVLERLGVRDAADLDDPSAGAASPLAVDATVLEFARRECADAEKEFLEVAAMVIPEADDEDHADDEADAEIIAAEAFVAGDDDLDLRIEPSAAS